MKLECTCLHVCFGADDDDLQADGKDNDNSDDDAVDVDGIYGPAIDNASPTLSHFISYQIKSDL